MISLERARELRAMIEKAAASLNDTDALEAKELYPNWEPDISYEADQRLRYDGFLWRVLMNHTSQVGWEPGVAPSLFAKVLIPDPDVIPDWEQPDSTNPYMTGDKVRYNDKVWISIIDNNVWAPGVYGWEEVVS